MTDAQANPTVAKRTAQYSIGIDMDATRFFMRMPQPNK
jgi:hypothetical protein